VDTSVTSSARSSRRTLRRGVGELVALLVRADAHLEIQPDDRSPSFTSAL
jgi:hypothetical protein